MPSLFFFFFFNDTATTEIYTLSLHDALPISHLEKIGHAGLGGTQLAPDQAAGLFAVDGEEHPVPAPGSSGLQPCSPVRVSPCSLYRPGAAEGVGGIAQGTDRKSVV